MELTEENNCILYRHIRLDKNEVFYIGIAKHKNRPYESGNRRSLFWNKIVFNSTYKNQKEAEHVKCFSLFIYFMINCK